MPHMPQMQLEMLWLLCVRTLESQGQVGPALLWRRLGHT